MGNMARQRWLLMSALGIGAFTSTACNMSVLDGLSGGDSVDASSPDDGADHDGGMPGDGDGDGNTDGGDGDGDGDVDAGPPEESNAFYSSFEPGEPEPRWLSSVEVDAHGNALRSGVNGQTPNAIPGSLSDQVIAVNASGENPPAEIASAAFDDEITSKWLVFATTGWLSAELAEPQVVTRYAITSANDYGERDPRSWTLDGSNDGSTWAAIDAQMEQTFGERYQTRQFTFENKTAYRFYRLNVTKNNGDARSLQLAEFQLSNGDDTPPEDTVMKSHVGPGPGGSANAHLSTGFTGTHALRFSGTLPGTGRGYSYNKVFDVNVKVGPESELSYLIFPDETPDDPAYPSTFSAVDLAFEDGTYLSQLKARDQDFAELSPTGQGASRTLYAGEWNRKVVKLGDVADGKRVRRILIGYDNPKGPALRFGGYLDDVRISEKSSEPTYTHPSEYVLTTRGTNSGPVYARGNTFPATAVPHGFNFWTPVTDASTDAFIYSYHRANNGSNLPMLQAVSLSHQPSPWIGDRQEFQVMPWTLSGLPDTSRTGRALAFKHENEIAQPHYYSVTFENGVRVEVTPTDHAAMFRFTFPKDSAALIFDSLDQAGGLTLDAGSRSLSAYTNAKSGSSAGAGRMFIYATFDTPVAASDVVSGPTGYVRFLMTGGEHELNMRIATSLISLDQAKKNLSAEISVNDTFDSVKERAQKLWDDKLSLITVEGASFDQLTTLYSNLYRLFLYPNSGFEKTGTSSYSYASPVAPPADGDTELHTGSKVVAGKIYVNNGFWDTYRATWPLYALLTPTECGEMIDGFLQLYKDGGWTARWSAPGYADLMTGTSSDVAFADAYLKGVSFDAETAYDAAVKNAMVRSPDTAVGRRGMQSSIFLGYVSSDNDAGFSWSMAGYLNDFGIAKLAEALAEKPGPRQAEFLENSEYFLSRSLNYTKLFDPNAKFFQGRNTSGAFRVSAAQYDPAVWGYDYTETNGWNMAFEPTHDGQGLANLYGGLSKLREKLDNFFATPELANKPGSYTTVIHEMREARDVRMGMLGLSNQASFHIPYMYAFTGAPSRTQAKVRDALARLWVGSSIGQGYLGDDDNGGLSAWQVFSALGFYPLQVGEPYYVIGSPLFKKATIKLENGKTITINAPNNSPENVYVQSLMVNKAAYTHTYISHETLLQGATLDFEMGPKPSNWGSGVDDLPISITTGNGAPKALNDATRSGGVPTSADTTSVNNLFDDTSTKATTFTNADPVVDYHFVSASPTILFYTLTSSDTSVDPTGWTLSGSSNGTDFTVLDTRENQTFSFRNQTRAFEIQTPQPYAYYKFAFTAAPGSSLAEVELLAQ
jgi:predicted alpha-1,2-mannosidase